jgi:hypothetical protein
MMIKKITVASRDERCCDCKITIEYKVVETPSWWRRAFFKEKPVIKIKVDSWYGYSNVWKTSSPRPRSVSMGRAQYFSRIWEHHLREKQCLKIKGPYKSIIYPTETQEDQETRGGAKVIELDSYKASRGNNKDKI